MRTPLLAGLLALVLPACLAGEISDVGGDPGGMGNGDGDGDGNGDGNNDPMPTPRVAATIDKSTVATELGKTENLVLTITSVDGFSGPVNITTTLMEGATDAGWTVTPNPATVELVADGTATATIEVKIPTDAVTLNPTLTVDLASSAAATSVTSAFTVANQYTIVIPEGTGTGSPHAGLPAINAPIRLRMGAKVIFHNADTGSHQIHASGGIQHQPNALAPGADYTVTPTDNATWYCHAHENGALSRPILVQ